MRLIIAFGLIAAALLSACSRRSPQAAAVERLAVAPSKFVLYSLNPANLHAETIHTATIFHGFDILGHADITDTAEQRALLRALADGMRENDSTAAACFDPRHALHIEQSGRSIDLVICFHCLQAHAYGFSAGEWFLTSSAPQPSFDESLRRHHIPLAPK